METSPELSINKLSSVAIVAVVIAFPYVLVYGTPFIIMLYTSPAEFVFPPVKAIVDIA